MTLEVARERISKCTSGILNLSGLNLTSKDLEALIPEIRNVPDLTRLFLYDNQITGVTSLESFTELTHLHLDNNQIVDPTPLQSLTNLEVLRLDRNRIPEQPLVEMRQKLSNTKVLHPEQDLTVDAGEHQTVEDTDAVTKPASNPPPLNQPPSQDRSGNRLTP